MTRENSKADNGRRIVDSMPAEVDRIRRQLHEGLQQKRIPEQISSQEDIEKMQAAQSNQQTAE